MQLPSLDRATATFFFVTDQRSIDRTPPAAAPRPSSSVAVKFRWARASKRPAAS